MGNVFWERGELGLHRGIRWGRVEAAGLTMVARIAG